ncbi:MAG TPA: hypothetical protein VLL75_16760 [Vicinamibacteria bacterium]|nr:hypothetical protein [Vicinamibacteria bacterium]
MTLAALAAASPAAAAEGVVAAGTRVRVTTSEGRLVGRLVEQNERTIVLAREKDGRTETLDVPIPGVSRFEVSEGRGGRGRAATIGAVAGLAAAVVIGVAGGENCSGDEMICFDHGTTALMSGILTIPLGALVGVAITPGERWRSAPVKGLSVQPVAARGGGLGVRVAIGF